ncbi:uncharacterized protein P884DRAFT_254536 [Thermothelomyces heterothallicus CBS 202.75]|uniref:uncharacterized protein n=1 Tax=Thermothelomyces heterothallicus CBS 202.75 TaxID=1149848 RepID=UPI003742A1EA
MDALQLKVDSISGEVREISVALKGYLEHGLASGRKVQPPRTKAGRDLLQHLLGRLDQVSTGLNNVRELATPHGSPTPSSGRGSDTPRSSASLPLSKRVLQSPAAQAEHPDPAAQRNIGIHSPAPAPVPAVVRPPDNTECKSALAPAIKEAPSAAIRDHGLHPQAPYGITLSNGAVYRSPVPSKHDASPLFDCTYQDIHVLNEELFEIYSSHPVVQDVGYFKIQVRDLPPLNVQKMARPGKDHATSFTYKVDRLGLVKIDTGRRFKFSSPNLPLPVSAKMEWSLEEQKELWNSSAANPPKGTWPYIIGNPLFEDVELSPGEKLRRRGRTRLEGINTQYVYFNLTGKTLTTMHREDAHVRSENLLRSGEHKFWCFIKPAFAKKLEERMAIEYPEMRRCSQAVRHLSRFISPSKLDEWGIEYTLDYCIPGQAIVTEPGTYHQVLNLGPNYAIAINLEYNSSPDSPPDYRFCDRNCPDKFAMSAEDFQIYDKPPSELERRLPGTPETTGSQEGHAAPAAGCVSGPRAEPAGSQLTQSVTPPPEPGASHEGHTATGRVADVVVERGQVPTTSVDAPRAQADARPAERSTSFRSAEQPTNSPRVVAETGDLTPRTQPQQLAPDVVAKPVSIVPQQPPFATHAKIQSVSPGGKKEDLPPFRKTARMINPDRDHDMPSPRPSKKLRVETASAPVSQDLPVKSALERLSTLLKAREAAFAGSLTADKLGGKPSFERLAHLVREWRRYSKSAPTVLGRFGLVRSVEESAHGYPELHVFLSRFFKMKLALCVEFAVSRPGHLTPHNYVNGMLQSLGWDETKRSQLDDCLREGKCWATICGEYDGLLCLIPHDLDCPEFALFKGEVARLHTELDNEFVRRLCSVGAILQKYIWECLELPEFIWESMTTAYLSAEQISPLLAPFRLLKQNHYNSRSGYLWPRPAGWDWDWPSDPSLVKPGDKLCSLCPRKNCRCAEVKIPQIPRISDDTTKGPGIRSVGTHKANDILGELVGELVPPGSCPGHWTMPLRRPDLDDETVAEIYPGRMGNWVRKVTHSTDPSATFRVMKISGRWRQMLVAVRTIGDGEEITAKYGNGYLKDQPYSLVEGLH